MEPKVFYKELYKFYSNLKIDQRYLEYDISKNEDSILVNAINGQYSSENLKTMIECFFLKGNQRLQKNLEDFYSVSGILNIEEELTPLLSELEKNCRKEFKIQFTETPILESYLQSNLKPKDFNNLINILLESSDIQCVLKNLNDAFKSSLAKAPALILNSIYSDFVKSKNKSFVIEEDYLDKYGSTIYETLVSRDILKADFEDFIKFCKGDALEKNIGFKYQSSLISFFKWLDEKKHISIKKEHWQYFAKTAYTYGKNQNKNLDADNLRKNSTKPGNSDIEEALKPLKNI